MPDAGVVPVISGDVGGVRAARLAKSASWVLMQPTTLCNLDCSYCYLPDRTVVRRMPVAVADVVASAVRWWSQSHPVTVLWHGGEPLAAGLRHFRALLECFGTGVGPVRHAVQTNATLIDDAWCELFQTWPVQVAVSMDGPAPDNTARRDRGGRNTTVRMLAGVETLRRHGVGFHAIAVVSDPTPQRAVRLYDWFVELGATGLGINIEERKGVHTGGRPTGSVVEFWAALAQRWDGDRRLRIREFEHVFGYWRDELAGLSQARADRPINPMPMICWDGQVVVICPDLAGFVSPQHGPFTIGNVLHHPLPDLITRAPRIPWVAEALAGIDACRRSCDHFAYCRGGQAVNKYFETGRLDATKTVYCTASKIDLMEGLLRHATRP